MNSKIIYPFKIRPTSDLLLSLADSTLTTAPDIEWEWFMPDSIKKEDKKGGMKKM